MSIVCRPAINVEHVVSLKGTNTQRFFGSWGIGMVLMKPLIEWPWMAVVVGCGDSDVDGVVLEWKRCCRCCGRGRKEV